MKEITSLHEIPDVLCRARSWKYVTVHSYKSGRSHRSLEFWLNSAQVVGRIEFSPDDTARYFVPSSRQVDIRRVTMSRADPAQFYRAIRVAMRGRIARPR